MNSNLYINYLTQLKPDEFISQRSLVEDLFSDVQETPEAERLKKNLLNLSNFGFETIAISHKNDHEGDMVVACLEKLFKASNINKSEISHVVHCSPTAIIGENGGIIGGVGRYVLDKHNLRNVVFVPMLGGCASIQPVFEVACSLARSSHKKVIIIFSLHASGARKTVTKENLLENKLRASPFTLFGDSCVSAIISPYPSDDATSFEIVTSKFNYTPKRWVAKAFIEEEMTMYLNGDTQRNMLKSFLLRELELSRNEFGVEYFFCHNQVPKFFNECMTALNIPKENAPEIVSKYGNLAFLTPLVNLCEHSKILRGNTVIGLFSAGEHTGVSESTIILRVRKSEPDELDVILDLKRSKSHC